MKKTIILILSGAILLIAESWPGVNGTGAQRNASSTAIALPLHLKWVKEIKGLSITKSRKGIIKPTARRSNNLSIQGGKIVTVTGAGNPLTTFANFGVWD